MSYVYENHRHYVFTEEGQVRFLSVLSTAQRCIEKSGAVRAGILLSVAGSGDSWNLMALVDWLVELGKLRDFGNEKTAWQDRVLVEGPKGIR